jgi:hypothetical protein
MSEEPGVAPGSSAFLFRLSLIGPSFPEATSEFRKSVSKHEVTSMFVALLNEAQRCPDVPGNLGKLHHDTKRNVQRHTDGAAGNLAVDR